MTSDVETSMTARAFFERCSPSALARSSVLAIRPVLEGLECDVRVSTNAPLPIEHYAGIYETRRRIQESRGRALFAEAIAELLRQFRGSTGDVGLASTDEASFHVTLWVQDASIVGVLVLPTIRADEPDSDPGTGHE
jgi:hypothetical protein